MNKEERTKNKVIEFKREEGLTACNSAGKLRKMRPGEKEIQPREVSALKLKVVTLVHMTENRY